MLEHLGCLKDVFEFQEISGVDLFTLNHDTLMEQFLDCCRVTYTDGFGTPINNVRYWSPEKFEDDSHKVRLFKLHGSVNWFLFSPNTATEKNEPVGIPLDGDFWHTKNPNGELQSPLGGRPLLLTGTFNKIFHYTTGIYADLYCQMRRALQETDVLIVCGYGFGDKGINTRLIEWAESSSRHLMLIIHEQPESLKKKARFAISKNWNYWLQNGKLLLIQKWIENTSWEEIYNAIQTHPRS